MWKLSKNERELARLSKLANEINKKDDSYRKTDEFKKLSEEEKQFHEDQFYQSEIGELWAQIGELQTKIFLRKLSKFGIPVPSRGDEKTQDKYWDNNFYGEYRELSTEGYYELNQKIREERKARREDQILWWIPILSVISGLVGSSIGVISVLRGWK